MRSFLALSQVILLSVLAAGPASADRCWFPDPDPQFHSGSRNNPENVYIRRSSEFVVGKLMQSYAPEQRVLNCLEGDQRAGNCPSYIQDFIEGNRQRFQALQKLYLESFFEIRGNAANASELIGIRFPQRMYKYPQVTVPIFGRIQAPFVDPTEPSPIDSAIRAEVAADIYLSTAPELFRRLNTLFPRAITAREQVITWRALPNRIGALRHSSQTESSALLRDYLANLQVIQGMKRQEYYFTLQQSPVLAFIEEWPSNRRALLQTLTVALRELQQHRAQAVADLGDFSQWTDLFLYPVLHRQFMRQQTALCGHDLATRMYERLSNFERIATQISQTAFDFVMSNAEKVCSVWGYVAFLPRNPLISSGVRELTVFAGTRWEMAPITSFNRVQTDLRSSFGVCTGVWAVRAGVSLAQSSQELEQMKFTLLAAYRPSGRPEDMLDLDNRFNDLMWSAAWNTLNLFAGTRIAQLPAAPPSLYYFRRALAAGSSDSLVALQTALTHFGGPYGAWLAQQVNRFEITEDIMRDCQQQVARASPGGNAAEVSGAVAQCMGQLPNANAIFWGM